MTDIPDASRGIPSPHFGPKPPKREDKEKEKVSKVATDALDKTTELDSLMRSDQTKFKFKDLALLLSQIPEDKLESSYKEIERAFRDIEHLQTVDAWIQRADLLDGIDVLVERSKGRLPHLQAFAPPPGKWLEGVVPLVPYSRAKESVKKVGEQVFKGLDEAREHLDLTAEYAKTAKIVKKATKQEQSILGFFFKIIARLLTILLGYYYTRNSFWSPINGIASFSLGMGIQSAETVRRKTEKEGVFENVIEYRGPKFLFGKPVHDFRTINEWFARDWTSEARSIYTEKAALKEASIAIKYGIKPDDEVSRVVVANADSRVRFHEIGAGHLGDSQELTGKVLDPLAQEEARKKRDTESYYEERYKFTAKNLVGRLNDDDMRPRVLPKKEGYIPLREAQHELLAGMYRALDRRGAVQVIQRLAPADIHNYVRPLNGEPLSNLEAVAFLSQLEGVTDEERSQYEELRKVFKEQEERLGRKSQSTIDVVGTLDSVAAPAIINKSSILAQNDRKIMLLKHEDGSFSIHVFIGATGVNRVDVDPQIRRTRRGEREGDMQFGSDVYEAKGEFPAASRVTTRDDQKKLRLGEWLGGFPINGSTVISYYLKRDFVPYPKMEEVKKKAAYGEGAKRAEIEVKVQMGDPILVKAEVRIAEILEENFPDDFALGHIDDLVDERLKNYPELYALINGVSDEALALREKVVALLNQRFKFLGQLKEIAQLAGFAPQLICGWLKEATPSHLTPELQQIRALLTKDESDLTLEEKLQLIKFQKQLGSIMSQLYQFS